MSTRGGLCATLAALCLVACGEEAGSRRPEGEEVVLPGGGEPDAGMEASGPRPPTQIVRTGGLAGIGTVAGGVLMTSDRYKLFGATGQAPGNEIHSATGNYRLRSGVVGVTP